MHKSTKIWLMVLLFASHILASNPAGWGEEITTGVAGVKLDQYLTRITPFGFSGTLLVVKNRFINLNKGYGMANREKGIGNTSETVFSVGSITKQFTAAAIMKLKIEGKLDTKDLIGKYLEGVPKDKKNITIQHLLTHTSGLVQDAGRDYDKVGRDETVANIMAQPLESKPGEKFTYTNAGYTLLAAIIEKVSGKSYEEFLHSELFQSAGMFSTGYRIPNWDEKVVAHWYVEDTDNGIPLDKPFPYWNLIGNGGILSTTGDMYRWHLALKGDSVLSSDAKKELFTPFLNDYAYGWDVLKSKHGTLIQHNGGSTLGNSAEMRMYMDSNVVSFLFCNQSYDGAPLIDAVRDKIETLIFGGEVTNPPLVLEFDSAAAKKYEGDYRLQSGGHLIVEVKNRALVITAQGQDAFNLLTLQEKAKLYLYDDLNDKSMDIFQAAVKGDYEPLKKVLSNPKERFKQVRWFIDSRIRDSREETGPIQKVETLGTLPSSFEEGAVETMVELKGERGSIFFRSTWRGNKNIGISIAEYAPPFSISFLPLSETGFAGYHIGMAKNVRINFNLANADSVTGLSIHALGEFIDVFKMIR